MQELRVKKKLAAAVTALADLIDAAQRVSRKYGHNEEGKPIEWKEWIELRRAITNARARIK